MKLEGISVALLNKIKVELKRLQESDISTLVNKVETLENEVETLKNQVSDLSSHTHSYEDTTIADTSDGSGAETVSNKTTGEPE